MLKPQEYEYIAWRLAQTLSKLGFSISSPLKAGYSAFAYRYGVRVGRRQGIIRTSR